MIVHDTDIAGVKLIEPQVFGDARGYFLESFNAERYRPHIGDYAFVQDNQSVSSKGILRGLHYQLGEAAQGKLVSVLAGKVLDVVVDIRPESATFGQHVTFNLSDENHQQVWVPPGLAHGFVTLSDTALFVYKCTTYYAPEVERSLAWNDPTLGIDWGVSDPTLSAKDAQGLSLEAVKAELVSL